MSYATLEFIMSHINASCHTYQSVAEQGGEGEHTSDSGEVRKAGTERGREVNRGRGRVGGEREAALHVDHSPTLSLPPPPPTPPPPFPLPR